MCVASSVVGFEKLAVTCYTNILVIRYSTSGLILLTKTPKNSFIEIKLKLNINIRLKKTCENEFLANNWNMFKVEALNVKKK